MSEQGCSWWLPLPHRNDRLPIADDKWINHSSWMLYVYWTCRNHYGDVIMGTMASEITSLTIVYSTVYSGADQRKHQSSASLAFVRGIHRGPVNSQHKWPVTRKMFHLMTSSWLCISQIMTYARKMTLSHHRISWFIYLLSVIPETPLLRWWFWTRSYNWICIIIRDKPWIANLSVLQFSSG